MQLATPLDKLHNAQVLAWCRKGFTVPHYETIGMMLPRLAKLWELNLSDNKMGDFGMRGLVDGLGRGAMPSLTGLHLHHNRIATEGAAALAAALDRGAMPELQILDISENELGDEGLISAAPALRRAPLLQTLYLSRTEIGDEGLAALTAASGEGEDALRRLKTLPRGWQESPAATLGAPCAAALLLEPAAACR